VRFLRDHLERLTPAERITLADASETMHRIYFAAREV
jgi:hypothetical protein